jgi:hypothetical protein
MPGKSNASPQGVLHFRTEGNCSSERRFGRSVSLRDTEVKKKLSSDIGPDTCIGAGCKMAQTGPIFAFAKGPDRNYTRGAQLEINPDYTH